MKMLTLPGSNLAFFPLPAQERRQLKHALICQLQNTKKLYSTTAKAFCDALCEELRTGQIQASMIACKEVDILLIDDLQYFVGKNATQKFFCSFLKDRLTANKQTVLFSECQAQYLSEALATLLL